MAYEKGTVTRQAPSIADLEKDLNYYRVELEVVQLKKAEAITFSLKMVLLIIVAAALSIFADTVLMKKEALHIFGIILIVFCIAAVGFGLLMLIQRVPMIVSQRHVDTGVMMPPARLIFEYKRIIDDKEKLLAQARAAEERMELDAEARKLEFEAERQVMEVQFGVGENIRLGDESGISMDDDLGPTLSLEDALSEIENFKDEEEETQS
ncbi:MAG: hypothetical protein IKS10_10100 [Lachnospiraceae bacterium]|nr:hypothetical protein [Lachnospiraceae bacterium]